MDRKSFQTQFDIVLKDYIQKKCHECSKYHSVDLIDDIINYTDSYARGGKRFRPYMVYVRYSMYGGVDTQYAMQVGLIHELIHLFALVHDDICDQGIIRHDISTYHRHITQMYGGDEHAGATQAMLVGDMIYTRAIELLLMLDLSADTRSLIYAMLQEVIVGQMVDVHLSLTPQLMSRDIISEKDHSKSGQYSFQCPMMVGASLTGCSKLDDIAVLGRQLGIAFQMRDDVLDVIDDNSNKTRFSDLQEGNQTILLTDVLDVVSAADHDYILACRGQKLTDEQITNLLAIYRQSGAIDTTIQRIHVILQDCSHTLEESEAFSSCDTTAMQEIISVLTSIR